MRHLKTLKLIIPPFKPSFHPRSTDLLIRDWKAAVSLLREHACLSALTVIIHMDHAHYHDSLPYALNPSPWRWARPASTPNTGSRLDNHISILKPFQGFGMKCFMVYLEWSWNQSFDILSEDIEHSSGCVTLDRCLAVRDAEIWLEKFVMGDEYDSRSEGRLDDQPSQWVIYWQRYRPVDAPDEEPTDWVMNRSV